MTNREKQLLLDKERSQFLVDYWESMQVQVENRRKQFLQYGIGDHLKPEDYKELNQKVWAARENFERVDLDLKKYKQENV